jgi:hypothetical protein
MAIGDRTYRYIRHTFGSLRYKNIYSASFAYTETRKKVAAGTSTAVLAATSAATGTRTSVTSSITNPDVPRALSVTPGGTSANILDSSVVITGTNVEGKTITESFQVAAGSTSTVNGAKAFKTVTSVSLPGAQGSGVTFAVGTTNKLGVNHRLYPANTTVKVYQDSSVATPALTLQGVPTVVADGNVVELNLVTPATTPNGTTFLTICYAFDNWSLTPLDDEPEYSTTTSTSSTSSSTSTTTATTTSTSSTSSSTSSTSSSTSSTSSSTSSTSTSTTTTP